MIQQLSILAQTGGGAGQPQQTGNPMVFFIGIVLFVGVFFFMTTRAQKKEREKKAGMLDNLKKNDRVMTIGGVIGTIVSVKDNEVVLKVDENTNTRMTFLKRSIQQVIHGEEDLKEAKT